MKWAIVDNDWLYTKTDNYSVPVAFRSGTEVYTLLDGITVSEAREGFRLAQGYIDTQQARINALRASERATAASQPDVLVNTHFRRLDNTLIYTCHVNGKHRKFYYRPATGEVRYTDEAYHTGGYAPHNVEYFPEEVRWHVIRWVNDCLRVRKVVEDDHDSWQSAYEQGDYALRQLQIANIAWKGTPWEQFPSTRNAARQAEDES